MRLNIRKKKPSSIKQKHTGRELKYFSKDTQIANKHMKRCSTPRIVRNSSQNHNEISLHSYYDGKSEKENRKA